MFIQQLVLSTTSIGQTEKQNFMNLILKKQIKANCLQNLL